MSHSKIWVHAVWCTKNRETVLKPIILQQLCAHIRLTAIENGIFIDSINGHDDHLHVLMILKVANSISKQIQLLKGESANWANKSGLIRGGLQWAVKYFATSVCLDRLDAVRQYIRNQQVHHKKQTFKEEYLSFLKSIGYEGLDEAEGL